MTTIAIIGTGVVGERIINQALGLEEYEIVAVFDEQQDRLAQIVEKYQVPAVTSMEELLALRADWVYVGTPPISHASLTEQIASRRLNVLSEKPLAHDYEQGEKMVGAIERYNVQSAMHFPMMYSPEVRYLKNALAAGELGDILRIELHTHFPVWPRPWQQNPWIATKEQGGFIREIFPHYLQLTHHLFGDLDILSHETMYQEDPTLCEVSVSALAKTHSGIPLLLNGASHMAQKERIEYKIFGSKKTMMIRNWSELLECTVEDDLRVVEVFEENENLLQACADYLNGKEALVIPFNEGLKVQKWIEELLQ